MPPAPHSILVVEDDDDLRGALATILTRHGYRVVMARHGREALDQLRHAAVCLILLDLFMPEMNGWEFREAQVRDPELAAIPVVIISADSSATRRAIAPGVIGTMTKPIDVDRLLQVIAQHC